jgi:hypothetical protein
VKVCLVLGGYAAAVVAGSVAAWLYDVRVSALPIDTSGGMYAAGQMMSSLAAFLGVALVPTLLALWFLRRHTGFWNGVAVGALLFAAVGLVAVLVTLVSRGATRNVALALVELLGLTQLLGVPLWLVAFGLFALLAPTREARRKLTLAAGIELAIGVCAFVHWFVPGSRL